MQAIKARKRKPPATAPTIIPTLFGLIGLNEPRLVLTLSELKSAKEGARRKGSAREDMDDQTKYGDPTRAAGGWNCDVISTF